MTTAIADFASLSQVTIPRLKMMAQWMMTEGQNENDPTSELWMVKAYLQSVMTEDEYDAWDEDLIEPEN
jgi:hypothetical protein